MTSQGVRWRTSPLGSASHLCVEVLGFTWSSYVERPVQSVELFVLGAAKVPPRTYAGVQK